MDSLFTVAAKHKASDLHIKAGKPPLLRIQGTIRALELPPLEPEDTARLLLPIMNDDQRKHLDKLGGIDFAYTNSTLGRFRVNIYRQRGSLSMAARRVNTEIPTFEQLHLPPVLQKIAAYQQGLIIFAGITGSGKSTSLAALLDHINETRRCHIVTIEDPIEYLLTDKKSFINQREVGIDVPSFKVALKHVVRQDPDVILVGEMRDEETFAAGLTAAETGHLVLGTLHSSNVSSTLGRILEFFPPSQHEQIRTSLVFNLKSIISQKLLPSIKEGVDRVPACEVMIMSPIMRKLIKDREENKITDAIKGASEEGMQDFTEALRRLVVNGDIEMQTALEVAPNEEALRMALKGIRIGSHGILG
jgi:twitching motility protein PilT